MMRNYSQTLRRQPSTKLSSLNTVSTVSVVFSSFWSFYVILKGSDPNLKVFSYSFSKPQGLGVSEVGRSAFPTGKYHDEPTYIYT